MKVTVLARTCEVDQIDKILQGELIIAIDSILSGKTVTDEQLTEIEKIRETNYDLRDLKDLRTLGGKLAGICYMPDDYLSSAIQDVKIANKRADMTAKNGHHSVFDHGNITLMFEGVPKIVAMLLNSTQYYTTSEKSARYTLMKPETELENTVYEKWSGIFKEIIQQEYPQIDDKAAQKLAIENARYLISVFTPTVMAYTTSYRQLNYLVDWCDKLVASLETATGEFNIRLRGAVAEFRELIASVLGEKTITDNKNRYFDFLPLQHGVDVGGHTDSYGDVYSIEYKMSFAALAQAQRHRTLHYEMQFSGDKASEFGFYVPRILEGRESLINAWLIDIKSVAYCYPQGTLVSVKEQGLAKDFFLKCKERLCGRAQLEIMNSTLDSLKVFKKNEDKLSNANKIEMDNMTSNGFVPKCGFKGYKCVEGCIWGTKCGFTRKI